MVISFSISGDLGWQRMVQAVTPNFAGYIATDTVSVDAWITPPDYTGLPPISLSAGNGGADHPILVPTGSKLLVQAQGVGSDVVMLADGSGDFTRAIGLEMDASKFGLGPRSQRYSMVVNDGVVEQLNVEQPGQFEVSSADYMVEHL